MIVATLLVWLDGGVLVAASCAALPLASYDVTLTAESVAVATNFNLAEIEALARQSPRKAVHPSAGLYIGTLAYSIGVVHDTLPEQCPCALFGPRKS